MGLEWGGGSFRGRKCGLLSHVTLQRSNRFCIGVVHSIAIDIDACRTLQGNWQLHFNGIYVRRNLIASSTFVHQICLFVCFFFNLTAS